MGTFTARFAGVWRALMRWLFAHRDVDAGLREPDDKWWDKQF